MIIRTKKILLGSGSPRRQLLLKELGYLFRTLTSDIDETTPHQSKGKDIAEYLAREKAVALSSQRSDQEILVTADTIVWFAGELLGKPIDASDAFGILSKLNGNMHEVFTGICLSDGKREKVFSVRSEVFFKKISDDEIRQYIKHRKPFDKAGAYGAQECLPEGMNPCSETENGFLKKNNLEDFLSRTSPADTLNSVPLIERINGSYFNVMGLPIVELVESLNLFQQ